MDKNTLYPIISVIVVIVVAAGIYMAAQALGGTGEHGGEEHGTNLSELYFRAIEKPIGVGDYTYSYRETYENGYWMDVTASRRGDLQYVHKKDPAYERWAYFEPNSTVLCIRHLGEEACASINSSSRFASYANELGRLLYDDEALRMTADMNRKLYAYGGLVFEGSAESEANGRACTEMRYHIDYSGLTVAQLNDMGLSASSPLVLRSKQYNYTMCVDPGDYEMYRKRIEFIDLGVYTLIESETTGVEWGTGMDVGAPENLSDDSGLYDIYSNAKQKTDEYFACLGANNSDRCIAEAAVAWGDPALCEEIVSERDFCFLNAGLVARDPSVCGKVSPSVKDTCHIEFADRMKDPSFCELIADAAMKAQCISLNSTGTGECTSDLDCARAGCSSQLCLPASQANGTMTTCEYVPEYACLAQTTCGCIGGSCGWRQTPEYLNCLNQTRGG